MPLDLTTDCTFTGPALREPFVKFNLEAEFNRLSLLPKTTGSDARAFDKHWHFIRRTDAPPRRPPSAVRKGQSPETRQPRAE